MDKVSVHLIEVAQNCGDHAQDFTSAVEVRDDETLTEAANRLMKPRYPGQTQHYTYRLEVRLVQPAPATTTPGGDDK